MALIVAQGQKDRSLPARVVCDLKALGLIGSAHRTLIQCARSSDAATQA
jgi:hypothetical protein